MLPLKIKDYIYYRKIDNPADSLTLYRFPVDELKKRNFSEGEVPYNRDEEIDFPEEVVFSVKDFTELYSEFALKDESIKNYVEKLSDKLSI